MDKLIFTNLNRKWFLLKNNQFNILILYNKEISSKTEGCSTKFVHVNIMQPSRKNLGYCLSTFSKYTYI